MSDDSGERQFSDREVARILKTAVVLQGRRGAATAARGRRGALRLAASRP